jgi:glyoxylase-like metal-dependent hydrolase (beta-lactamase superfamily II)
MSDPVTDLPAARPKMNPPAEVAPGVYRLGTDLVNFYAISDGDRVTIVDAGLPGFAAQIEPALDAIGRSLDQVDALVLTHADGDHIGAANFLREAGARVLVNADDAERLRTATPKKTERGIAPYLVRPAAYRLIAHFAAGGGLRLPKVEPTGTFADGDLLDVPGALRVIHTPGHTEAHCALLLEATSVLFVGDALCTLNPLTGRQGPQLMPSGLNVSSEQALASVERLAGVDAQIALPGHGPPWTGGMAAAAERVRQAGTS